MLSNFFNSIFNSGSVPILEVILCMIVSIVLGIFLALIYMFKNVYTKGFILTLSLMPCIVQIVIMLVNGNLGTGVAVAGAFSLVRFRSAPGSAREILSIFLAMAVGLATGMGYIGVAVLFTLITGIIFMALNLSKFGEGALGQKSLKVTIPECLDYTFVFDDVFKKYLKNWEIVNVRTMNMGSLFRIEYKITFKNPKDERDMINDLRCRNGNLEIMCGRVMLSREEL